MTSTEARDKLRILFDERELPELTDSEIYSLLNMAQLEVLNRMIPSSLGGVVNFELDQNTYENIVPLIWEVDIQPSSYTTSGNSITITRSAITTALRSQSSDAGCNLLRILNIGIYVSSSPFQFSPVKYTKKNDFNIVINNYFKKPSTSQFLYTYKADTYIIAPKPTTFTRITCMKTPKIMDTGNSPDFNDFVMNQVILKALELAGVSATGNIEYIQAVRNSGIQSAE
jgi:hypothetical protein